MARGPLYTPEEDAIITTTVGVANPDEVSELLVSKGFPQRTPESIKSRRAVLRQSVPPDDDYKEMTLESLLALREDMQRRLEVLNAELVRNQEILTSVEHALKEKAAALADSLADA